MNENQSIESGTPRRRFLTKILAGWSFLSVIPVLGVVVRFLTPVSRPEAANMTIRFEDLGSLSQNSSKIVRFGKEPAIIVHTDKGQYKAFMARCTHLGCVVKYNTEGPQGFHCNCHGSSFDLTGRNLSGPAPRPLTPLRVSLDGDSLVIKRVNT